MLHTYNKPHRPHCKSPRRQRGRRTRLQHQQHHITSASASAAFGGGAYASLAISRLLGNTRDFGANENVVLELNATRCGVYADAARCGYVVCVCVCAQLNICCVLVAHTHARTYFTWHVKYCVINYIQARVRAWMSQMFWMGIWCSNCALRAHARPIEYCNLCVRAGVYRVHMSAIKCVYTPYMACERRAFSTCHVSWGDVTWEQQQQQQPQQRLHIRGACNSALCISAHCFCATRDTHAKQQQQQQRQRACLRRPDVTSAKWYTTHAVF